MSRSTAIRAPQVLHWLTKLSEQRKPRSQAVAVGIETDRGLLVGALVAAGYQVCAVNPQVVSRYRGRHGSSRAKSDRGDAKVLAAGRWGTAWSTSCTAVQPTE